MLHANVFSMARLLPFEDIVSCDARLCIPFTTACSTFLLQMAQEVKKMTDVVGAAADSKTPFDPSNAIRYKHAIPSCVVLIFSSSEQEPHVWLRWTLDSR